MRKIIVGINSVVSGMKMAETIFNDYGGIIVSETTILDEHIIRKLKNLDITKIKVLDESEEIIHASDSELFRAQYNVNVEVVKDVLHDISVGRNVNMHRIEMVSDSLFERINENRDIVGCINQIRSVDDYTFAHSVNVSLLAMLIAKWLRFDSQKIRELVQAGLLHDIGKARISEDILNKKGSLSKEEFDEIKKHPVYGYRAVENIPGISKDICLGILMHHERNDGSGYPVGIKGDKIHEFAKIIAVADIYDAMTSNRSYRERESPFEVFEIFENNSFGVLDPVVTNAFLSNIAAYYIGDLIQLNNGMLGEIVYINPMHISQPLVKVGDSYIDLTVHTDIKIAELI
ncbi:MAG: HD-GYP domain-containing protein [Bacillota bacterium]|nr:HD-GYP domain-containing protein [Bacillota bacterium]